MEAAGSILQCVGFYLQCALDYGSLFKIMEVGFIW